MEATRHDKQHTCKNAKTFKSKRIRFGRLVRAKSKGWKEKESSQAQKGAQAHELLVRTRRAIIRSWLRDQQLTALPQGKVAS